MHLPHICHGLTQNGKPGYIQSGKGTSVGLFPGSGPSHISWGLWHWHTHPPSSIPYCLSFLAVVYPSYGASEKVFCNANLSLQLFIFNQLLLQVLGNRNTSTGCARCPVPFVPRTPDTNTVSLTALPAFCLTYRNVVSWMPRIPCGSRKQSNLAQRDRMFWILTN